MLAEGRKDFGAAKERERCGTPSGACIATSQIHVRSKCNDCSIELVECDICFCPFFTVRVCLRVEGGGIRCKKDLNVGKIVLLEITPFFKLRNRAPGGTQQTLIHTIDLTPILPSYSDPHNRLSNLT